VLALQRSIGNHAVRQLLQREPTNEERLSQVAKQLGAPSMVDDVNSGGVQPADIHVTRRLQKDKDDGIRQGLNIAPNIGGAGRTGFVRRDGTYLGDILPADAPDPLPQIAITLDPDLFTQGDDAVRTTLRHELEHAMHAQLLLRIQAKWRASLKEAGKRVPTSENAAETQLFAFAKGQKLSAAELDLIRGDTTGNTADTELLAYLEGFAMAFAGTPAPDPALFSKALMPLAIEQLRGAAEHGWGGADDVVKTVAKDRLAKFYRALDASKQDLLRDWLFYLQYRATTAWPSPATGAEATAAKVVHNVFGGHVTFLEWLLGIVGEIEFAAHKLAAPSSRTPVKVSSRPKESGKVKVGAGEVKVFTGVGYTFAGESRSHGISLSYDGPDASEMRWLQFIWREVVPDGGKGITGTSTHQGQTYPLTTEPTEPSQIGWNTDSATYLGGGASAFYEVDNAVNRTDKQVEMFDEPSAPYAADVKQAFAARGSGGGVTGRAHLVQYLVHGKEVRLRAEEVLDYRYEGETGTPDAKPRFVSAQPATAIDPGARARLHQQFKDLDYLP
jgi:hypothetical protein